MKEIINVKSNEKEFCISINGSNVDLLSGIAHILMAMEKESDMLPEIALRYIESYLKDEGGGVDEDR